MLNDDPTAWTVLKNGIVPTKPLIYLEHQFSTAIYNRFAMVSFEDGVLQTIGQFTGVSSDIIIGPEATGGMARKS